PTRGTGGVQRMDHSFRTGRGSVLPLEGEAVQTQHVVQRPVITDAQLRAVQCLSYLLADVFLKAVPDCTRVAEVSDDVAVVGGLPKTGPPERQPVRLVVVPFLFEVFEAGKLGDEPLQQLLLLA